jgi:hypothetical protein
MPARNYDGVGYFIRLMTNTHPIESFPDEMITIPESTYFREWVSFGKNKSNGQISQLETCSTIHFDKKLEEIAETIKNPVLNKDFDNVTWYEIETTTKFKKVKKK